MDGKKKLIRDIFLVQVILLSCSFFGCGSEGGSTPKSVLDSDGESTEIVSFEGKWNLYETKQDCNGESSSQTELQIVQDKEKATLSIAPAGRPIDCSVVQTELQCAGTMTFENGEILEFTEATFWYDENRNLEGEASWTHINADNEECAGASVFSSISPTDTETDTDIGTDTDTTADTTTDTDSDEDDESIPLFEGRWSIIDTPQACPYYTARSNYSSEITQTGTKAMIHSILRSSIHITFPCNITDGELRCSGEFVNVFNGHETLMVYSKYNLRLTDSDHLTGDSSWTIHNSANGLLLCSGTSILSGVREEGTGDTREQP